MCDGWWRVVMGDACVEMRQLIYYYRQFFILFSSLFDGVFVAAAAPAAYSVCRVDRHILSKLHQPVIGYQHTVLRARVFFFLLFSSFFFVCFVWAFAVCLLLSFLSLFFSISSANCSRHCCCCCRCHFIKIESRIALIESDKRWHCRLGCANFYLFVRKLLTSIDMKREVEKKCTNSIDRFTHAKNVWFNFVRCCVQWSPFNWCNLACDLPLLTELFIKFFFCSRSAFNTCSSSSVLYIHQCFSFYFVHFQNSHTHTHTRTGVAESRTGTTIPQYWPFKKKKKIPTKSRLLQLLPPYHRHVHTNTNNKHTRAADGSMSSILSIQKKWINLTNKSSAHIYLVHERARAHKQQTHSRTGNQSTERGQNSIACDNRSIQLITTHWIEQAFGNRLVTVNVNKTNSRCYLRWKIILGRVGRTHLHHITMVAKPVPIC